MTLFHVLSYIFKYILLDTVVSMYVTRYSAQPYEHAYGLSGSVRFVRLLDELCWLTIQKVLF